MRQDAQPVFAWANRLLQTLGESKLADQKPT